MDADEAVLQLYKIEYEKAAERYDNIYRSIWTIFSYLTAVTAGLLAFGSERIEPHALICMAGIPLLFWFWTTYLPLDRYGNATLNRLSEIEDILNKGFKTKLEHFAGAKHGVNELSIFKNVVRALFNPNPYLHKPLEGGWPKFATTLWAKWGQSPRCQRVFRTFRDWWHQFYRARFAICLIFILFHFLVVHEARAFRDSGKPLFLEKTAAATPVPPSQNVTITGSSPVPPCVGALRKRSQSTQAPRRQDTPGTSIGGHGSNK